MPNYLLVRADLVEYFVNAARHLLPQIVVETQLEQEQEHVFAGRFGPAGCQTERRCLPDVSRRYPVDSPNAMSGQSSLDLRRR